jgi:hypothetical protein
MLLPPLLVGPEVLLISVTAAMTLLAFASSILGGFEILLMCVPGRSRSRVYSGYPPALSAQHGTRYHERRRTGRDKSHFSRCKCNNSVVGVWWCVL